MEHLALVSFFKTLSKSLCHAAVIKLWMGAIYLVPSTGSGYIQENLSIKFCNFAVFNTKFSPGVILPVPNLEN